MENEEKIEKKLEEKKINLPKNKLKKEEEEEEEEEEEIEEEPIENFNEYRFKNINKFPIEPIGPPNDPNIIFPVLEKHECEDKKKPDLSKLKKKK